MTLLECKHYDVSNIMKSVELSSNFYIFFSDKAFDNPPFFYCLLNFSAE